MIFLKHTLHYVKPTFNAHKLSQNECKMHVKEFDKGSNEFLPGKLLELLNSAQLWCL